MSKKSPPFTETEKTILVEEVRKLKNVVENKKTDATTNAAKASAWEKISFNFNSHEGVCPRNADQLKRCWEKLKCSSKTAIKAEKRHRMETGNGLSICDSKVRADVLAIAPYIAEEIPNNFDSANCRMFASCTSTAPASGGIDATSNSSLASDNVIATVTTENSSSNSSGYVTTAPAVASIIEPIAVNDVSPRQEYEIEYRANVMTPTTNARRQKTTIFDPEIRKRLKKLDEGIKQQEEMHLLKMQNEKELHDLQRKILEKRLKNEELKEKILLKELENSKN